VWLGNARGNTYGLHHVSLNPADEPFWQFSWDQLAAYDLPAKMFYLLNVTQADNFVYVGHSEGTETFFALFSNQSDPNALALAPKIRYFAAFAPIAFLGNLEGTLLRDLAKIPQFLDYLTLGHKSVFESSVWYIERIPELCTFITQDCEDILCAIAGCVNDSYTDLNKTHVPFMLAHFPAGTSTRNLVHYDQSERSNLFEKYNFGLIGNEQHYKQKTPPQYDLSAFNIPTLIFSGGDDKLADPTDVAHLLSIIPPPITNTFLPHYGHMDFVWGVNAHSLLYQPLINFLN